MADYIFIRKSRNAISSLAHVILNLLLAVVSIGSTVITGSALIGLILILVAKWRIFAVNHRYWLVNLRASLVDLVVGVSFVLLAYAAGTTFLPVHFILMAAYALWLIVLKPRSSLPATIVQSLVAILVGSTTVAVFAAMTNSVVPVLLELVVGYAATYHVLVQSSDSNPGLMALTAGLIFGEITWLLNAWLIIYTFNATGVCVSQLALILTVLAFAFFELYLEMSKRGGKIKFKNIALPIIFSVIVILVLLIGFSQPRFNIH